ncbi:hypothetical protein EOD23_02710 [Mesorhizobium sp. USDA-HM6]|nr:hypothetical protein EOD23_02710 [Mesorhizobium sp. USDA-HM6]
MESFSGRPCDEFLNETLFTSLAQRASHLKIGTATTISSGLVFASAG